MGLRAVRLRNLLLLIAIFATIVVAGCWDSRRTMQHVLDDGYPAIVQITGAQFQRWAPVAFDGWRPRFVEQALSVDLKWDGKDGKPHEFHKVPVTEAFESTIISGEQVKLAILPGKVLDDPLAVPVIDADAEARFESLEQWIRASAYLALVGWVGFAGFTLYLRRRKAAVPGAAEISPTGVVQAFPPRRTLFGAAALLVGAILTFRAWSLEDASAAAVAGGIETEAEITSATTIKAGGASSHVIQVSWKDTQGGVHHFGPLRVSEAFWNKITRDGVLVVHETRLRYRTDEMIARPVLLDDRPETSWRLTFGLWAGLALMAIGAVSLFSAVLGVRQAVREGRVAKITRQIPKK